MQTEDQTKEVFVSLKNLLLVHRQMGFDPPPIPRDALGNLDADVRISQGSSNDVHSLEDLRSFIGECARCRLHKGRTHLVFGEGSPKARIVFVGEGPGREEDLMGRPFVGEAGKLLTRIIWAMGLKREDVYICNVVKCRPPKNRDPENDEVGACIPFLKKQLDLIKPEVICVLGRVAGQGLLGEGFKITLERGRWHDYMGIRLMPTYHPAYLLRNPSAKRQVWQDVQEIMRHLGLEVKNNV